MSIRNASRADAPAIHALIAAHVSDGTLLARSVEEIRRGIGDFVVAVHGGKVVGCGALHLYGSHLAEIRSITVRDDLRGRGHGRDIVDALLRRARRLRITGVCLFTREPEFFASFGFIMVDRERVPEKFYKDCRLCPRLHACDEIAMVMRRAGGIGGAGREHRTCRVAWRSERDEHSGTPGSARLPVRRGHGRHQGQRTSRPRLMEAPERRNGGRHVHAQPRGGRAGHRGAATPGRVPRAHARGLVNAGNANCATGPQGLEPRRSSRAPALAGLLGVPVEQVIPSSTGIIGVPLPVGKLLTSLPGLLARRSDEAAAAFDVARAIMTTDTRPKTASALFRSGRKSAAVLGIAKGAGMIHPDMATMLVYLFTDAAAPPSLLRRALRQAVDRSFNCISIDGDTSTNDTVILMASGAAGVNAATDAERFGAAVSEVCASLATQIVADGEGVGHCVSLHVEGAATFAAAQRIARTVAGSPLVKTAWAGADPNWGRMLAATGRSGVAIDPDAVDIWIAGQKVCASGAAVAFDAKRAHRAMSEPRYEIRIRVGDGPGAARLLTSDLTSEYVRINADYST